MSWRMGAAPALLGGSAESVGEGHQRVGDRHQAGEGTRRELRSMNGLPNDEEQERDHEKDGEKTTRLRGWKHGDNASLRCRGELVRQLGLPLTCRFYLANFAR